MSLLTTWLLSPRLRAWLKRCYGCDHHLIDRCEISVAGIINDLSVVLNAYFQAGFTLEKMMGHMWCRECLPFRSSCFHPLMEGSCWSFIIYMICDRNFIGQLFWFWLLCYGLILLLTKLWWYSMLLYLYLKEINFYPGIVDSCILYLLSIS